MLWPLSHKKRSHTGPAVAEALLTVVRDSQQLDCGYLIGGEQSQFMAKMMEQVSARVPFRAGSEKPKYCLMGTKDIFYRMSAYVTVQAYRAVCCLVFDVYYKADESDQQTEKKAVCG